MYAHHLYRALQCLATANGELGAAAAAATARFGQEAPATKIVKSWVLAETSDDARAATREILQLAARQSLIGKIRDSSPFRRAKFDLPVLQFATGSTAAFIAAGGTIPVSSVDLEPARIPIRKIAGIIPATAESARTFDDLEPAIAGDLTRGLADGESAVFFSAAAGTEAAPAGILYDVVAGAGSAAPATDIDTLLTGYGGNLSSSVLLTSPRNGVKLFKAGFLGSGARGGEVAGIAHVTHHAVPEDQVAIVDAPRILLADEGDLFIDFAAFATLNVTGDDGETTQVSLMQTNSVAWRVVRTINWSPAAGAVAWLDNVAW